MEHQSGFALSRVRYGNHRVRSIQILSGEIGLEFGTADVPSIYPEILDCPVSLRTSLLRQKSEHDGGEDADERGEVVPADAFAEIGHREAVAENIGRRRRIVAFARRCGASRSGLARRASRRETPQDVKWRGVAAP